MIKDFVGGLLLLAVAVVYYQLAGDIQRSMLADEVGAHGVPQTLAVVLGILATLLLIKAGVVRLRAARQAGPAGGDDVALKRSFLRMLGMLGIGVAYLFVLPWLGYIATLALLLAAVTVYQGGGFSPRVALVAVGGALAFWLIFVQLLGIPLPAGIWAKWL